MAERPPTNASTNEADGNGLPDDPLRASQREDGAEEPRREASARFVVKTSTSSAVQLREAMDPANQSLADALRLSYRVLQLGILALIVTFLFSGFQTVREGATGVKTIFGRITGEGGAEQLAPGLQPFWPYPIGELIVFDQKSTIRMDKEFEPRARENLKTKEEQIAAEEYARDLAPARDGYVLTADGDIAHVAVSTTYTVQDAVEFLERTSPEQAQKLVRAALMRAVVLASGQFSLRDLIDQRDAPQAAVREYAQEFLDRLHSGIIVGDVVLSDRSPPRFVDAQFREVQAKRATAQAVVERANQEVAAILTGVAGEKALEDLTNLIREYDAALVRGDKAGADGVAAQIGQRFEADDIGGDVARIIQRSKAMAASNQAALTRELSRLRGLQPAFESNPRQLTRQLWLEAVRTVLGGPEVEIISPPMGIGSLDLKLLSSAQIMQVRRKADLERRKRAAEQLELNLPEWVLRGSQIRPEGDMKRLERDGSKGTGRDDISVETSSSTVAPR
ncbi:MAG: SPFH domain-containing protein [Phycisphaerales bacterium]